MKQYLDNHSTKGSLAGLVILIAVISFAFNLWHYNRIKIDAPSYFAYLPSAFIYNDLTLNYVNANPDFFRDKIWFQILPNVNHLIKSTYGMSAALSPLFFIVNFTALLFVYPHY